MRLYFHGQYVAPFAEVLFITSGWICTKANFWKAGSIGSQMMREKTINRAIAFGVFTLLFVALCRPVHFAGPVSGRAYDIDTGEGLEGAIVAAVWTVKGLEGAYVSTLSLDETVTDEDGNFKIPGWGPKFVTPSIFAYRDPEAPTLFIFKSGYRPTTVRNAGKGPPFYISGPVRLSELNDRTLGQLDLPLERFEGALEEYMEPLTHIAVFGFRALWEHERCYWKRIPKLVLALDAEGNKATRRGISAVELSMYNRPRASCGTPAAFFNVRDDGLKPCESRDACVQSVERYNGPPDVFWLAVAPSAWFSPGDPDDPIEKALARRGWETNGYEMRDGYYVYRAREKGTV